MSDMGISSHANMGAVLNGPTLFGGSSDARGSPRRLHFPQQKQNSLPGTGTRRTFILTNDEGFLHVWVGTRNTMTIVA